MQIALFDGPKDSHPKPVDVTWSELLGGLRAVKVSPEPCSGKECPVKFGRAWSPTRYVEGATSRADASVAAVSVAVFDLDGPTPEAMGALGQALQGTSYAVHATHAAGSYRLIIELTSEVPGELWPELWVRLIKKFNIPADLVCGNLSRIYFFPAIHTGREFEFFTGEGVPVDWRDEVGGTAADVSQIRESLKASVRPPVSDLTDPRHYVEGPINLDAFRESLGKMRRPESRELLNIVLSGKPLAGAGERDNTVNRAASLLATVPARPYPPDAAIALMTPSITAMETQPEGLPFWLDKARYSYLRAIKRRLENDEKDAENQALLNQLIGRDAAGVPAVGGDDAWRGRLLYSVGPDGDASGLKKVGLNAGLILANDPAWKGKIRFNAVTKEIDVELVDALKNISPATLDVEVMNWLANSDYKLVLKSHEVREQLLAVARRNEFDPLRDYLLALKWDGHDRVSNFLRNYYGAKGDEAHLQRIGRAWLVSAVARALEPGCRVDTVLMFQGGQGVGKTTSLEILGGEFFTNTKIELNDRDSRMLTARSWIVELAELATMKRYDDEARKAFFSQAEDRLRPPYGRVIEVYKRRCVFVGTTNADEYLTDPTGARRYWPVEVGTIDLEKLREDRGQLWAQAVALYQAHEPWWLNKTEAERAEEVAKNFTRGSIHAEQIRNYYLAMEPAKRPFTITNLQVLHDIFQIPAAQVNESVRQGIGFAMHELKFVKRRRRIAGALIWVYEAPAALMKAAKNAGSEAVDSESLPN